MNLPNSDYESNELINRLPPHLKQFIIPQHYEHYTPINHAVWRFVMRKNLDFLSKHGHESYLDGLQKTGISIDTIPNMYGMNRILKEIGWAAVAVDGFIPPNAFMEFQANKVLVIASEIRQLENIEYTPAPDIIHEAAGHAPIIANPDYAEYLRRLGAVGAKAILSEHDVALYEAVRKLSILKEAGGLQQAISDAEAEVESLQAAKVELSEMAQIRNLQWWTVEYGLIGDLNNPKIYGAGLLSSIGESKSCLSNEVTKLPYSIEASKLEFDITKPQPQLFVTPDFSYLMQVLEEFANTLSIRNGGYKGLVKLIKSSMVGTIELSTGLQISGKFVQIIQNDDREVIFFRTEGPTALAYREKELIGHGVETHRHGFSSPLGKLKGISLAIEDMGPLDLKAYNFYDGKRLSFEFVSGIRVEGLNVTGIRNVQGKLMLIQLSDCTVTYQNEVLYKPEYGVFDMAVGKDIVSAFAGAADHFSFPNLYNVSKAQTNPIPKSNEDSLLEALYQKVRDYRNNDTQNEELLVNILAQLVINFPNDWLLAAELLELAQSENFRNKLIHYLNKLASNNTKITNLVHDFLKANAS